MFAKPLMFLSSYAPLFAIVAIRVQSLPVRVACVVLAMAGVGALVTVLTLDRRSARAQSTIVSVRNAGAEAASYLAGYLLPFLTVTEPSVWDVVAYALFIGVVGVVTIKTGVIQVNPMLFVFGYLVLRVEDGTGAEFYVLTRRRLRPGTELYTTSLSNDVRVDRQP